MVLGTLIAYMAWLGWDQRKELGADGYLHGPYQWWQVAGLAITVIVVAAIGGRLGYSVIAVFVISGVLTLAVSIDAATDLENDGLWPIGSIQVAIGSFVGVYLVSSAAEFWTRRRAAEVIDAR